MADNLSCGFLHASYDQVLRMCERTRLIKYHELSEMYHAIFLCETCLLLRNSSTTIQFSKLEHN